MEEESKSLSNPFLRSAPSDGSFPHSKMQADESSLDNSLPSIPHGYSRQKSTKTYKIDKESLTRYKRLLQKRVAWSFILIFLVIFQRIFASYFRGGENDIVIKLQKTFGITYENYRFLLGPILFVENYQYSILLLSHYFVIAYYFYNAVVCLKIMYVYLNAAALVSLVQIMFGDPRPYWDHEEIIGAGCPNSYGFPSFTIFSILFLFIYSWHCFEEDDDEDESWNCKDLLKKAVFFILFGAYCFLKVLAGLEYLSQLILTILYVVLFYYLALFFDKAITNLVEKSSIDIQVAKRYSIFWMVYILVFSGFANMIYQTSETFFDISWFSNYFSCLDKHSNTLVLTDTPYYQLLGPWGSFLKTLVLFLLLGVVFGASKAFRDFKGVLWYTTSSQNRLYMTALASLCILPSWILVTFQKDFLAFLEQGGIDAYIFNALHFMCLYLFIFGALPKLAFRRLGLLNNSSDY